MNKTNEEIIEEFKENKSKFYGRGANPEFIAWNNIGNYFLKALEAKDAGHKEIEQSTFCIKCGAIDEAVFGAKKRNQLKGFKPKPIQFPNNLPKDMSWN